MIIKLKSGKYQVKSHSGKNMGIFRSRKGAEKRLAQVEYFKKVKGKNSKNER